MTPFVLACVICAAILHAGWNAVLRGVIDRLWSMMLMMIAVACVTAITLVFVPWPNAASWPYVIASALVYSTSMFLLWSITMPAIYYAMCGKPPAYTKAQTVMAPTGGIVSILAYGVVIWAMQHDAIGVVSALRDTSVVQAAIIGRVFLVSGIGFIGGGAILMRHGIVRGLCRSWLSRRPSAIPSSCLYSRNSSPTCRGDGEWLSSRGSPTEYATPDRGGSGWNGPARPG